MAETTIATGDATTKKLYDEKLFREIPKESFFMQMAGTDMSMPVYLKNDFAKQKGDRVTMTLTKRLKGAPITSSGTVEGNEEDLIHATYNLTLEEYNLPTKYDAKLTAQRPAWNLPAESRSRVIQRGGETIDELLFEALEASPTKVFYPGTATSKATITTADKITPQLLQVAKVWASTGGNRSQPPIEAPKVGGKKAYVYVCHPDQFYDLWNDSTIQNSMQLARERGVNNPLWKDGDLMWNNIVIKEHENINIFTDGGSGSDVPGSYGYLLGSCALCWAWGQKPEVVTEYFDYKRKVGVNFNYLGAAGKPVFDSVDHGVVAICAARTQISDS